MYRNYIYVLLAILLFPCIAYPEINPNLPDLGEPFEQEIDFNRIRTAVANGHYDLALNISMELLYVKARQKLLDKKSINSIITKASEKLQEIINRTDLTNDEKGEEVVKVIVASLEPYEYMVSDALNTSIKHSIEHGATFINWNDKTAFSTCWGAYLEVVLEMVCDSWGCHYEQHYQTIYRTEYLTQVPDYYIYRVVDGQQKLITKIKGYKNIEFNTFGLFPNDGWTDLISNAFDYFKDIPEGNIENGRLFWIDLHSDVRDVGETLSYRIVSDVSPYKANDCGSNDLYESTISADADGDGKMDFIPASAYQKYFGKYYGWVVPVITMLN